MRLVSRVAAAVAGSVFALLAAEGLVRLWHPYNVGKAGVELPLFRGDQTKAQDLYTLDDSLGFRPKLPTRLYGAHGARTNEYQEEPAPGRERLLFIGDSVTFYGRLIRALRQIYGEERYEYWNGGVTAYNTTQEVEYFRRYTLATHPDRVILTFHPNDFMATPISFRAADGHMVVIAPSKQRSQVNPWLFRWSHVYRYFVGATRAPNSAEAEQEIRARLIELRELCATKQIDLAVLVLPHLAPLAEWTEVHRRHHDWILRTLSEIGLRFFDLKPPLEEALGQGLDVQQTPGDHDHPSDAVCTVFARCLAEQGLLSATSVAPGNRAAR